MKSVQFDENLNAKHLRLACSSEGLVTPIAFPSHLKSKSDPDVLAALIPENNLIVTLDRGFIEDHASDVPDSHGGVLVVEQDVHTVGTMTSHRAQKILADFKKSCPDWHIRDWRNSIICLSQSLIEISHVSSGSIERDGSIIDRTAAGWRDLFLKSLAENAARTPPNGEASVVTA